MLKLNVADLLPHVEREDGKRSFLSIASANYSILSNIYCVASYLRSNKLVHWIFASDIVDLDDPIPAACEQDVAVVGQELRAEHLELVPRQLQTIRVHGGDLLSSGLVVEIDLAVFACGDEVEAVWGEVTSTQAILLLHYRVLQFARGGVPMADVAISAH